MIEIKVEGMQCSGCENRIQNVLKKVEGVTEVKANYKSGIVSIKTNKDIEKDILYKKIEDLGYQIII